ncbi:hypothetical protein [Streptomyces ziwulingensis]|uniref:Tetratricopeptide repeat protein n=1 Tax=Streptomyces ziwulingensis TaxID=1045501 RepID=A0ABP9BFM2_9ACTN
MGKRAVDADGDLGVVITGDHNSTTTIMGDVIVRGASKAAPSVYEAEIRILAAAHFEGREDELAAMSAFAVGADPHGTGYWRWLAPAWSGKTALMAQFALNPPADVDVLAFFITARLAGRSDRTAFLSTLQQQLRAYLEDSDVDCGGYGGFHDALRRAAERALNSGRQLVLVVDGMDEDSGVESAFAGYSIAGLLPRTPPDGLRVIVAGRPNPPVPSDVSPGHPLRTPLINHDLAESAAARVVREDAERSLNAMIAAAGVSLDLVGLTSAAGGGLSAADFALLVRDRTARHIEAVLGGATGRSFQLRPAQWTLSDGRRPSLYSFAHQELLVGARQMLRPSVLGDYRSRVHDFIDSHREQGWPADTPEYALTGYPQMLREQRDTRRLTDLATDPARHERLWLTTGSDAGALTEIADAFALHRAEPEADLVSCVRLSHCREELGHKALSFPAMALTVLAKLGHGRKAAALLTARVAFSPHEAWLFEPVLREALVTGEAELVLSAVHALVEPSIRDTALRSCAEAMAVSGQIDRAAALARSIGGAGERAWAFVVVAREVLRAGRPEQAAGLAREAAEAVSAMTDTVEGFRVGAEVAEVWVAAGRPDEAAALARTAAGAVVALRYAEHREQASHSLAVMLARAGQREEAIRLVRTIGDGERRSEALVEVAQVLVETERPGEAADLAREAAKVADELSDADDRGRAYSGAAFVLLRAGRREEAVRAARRIGDPERRSRAWTDMMRVLVEAGQGVAAAGLADEAAEAARTVDASEVRVSMLTRLAKTWVEAGRLEEAVSLASSIGDPGPRATALSDVARTMAAHGHTEEAIRHGLAAADLVEGVSDPKARVATLTLVAPALQQAGRTEEAARFARTAAETALTVSAPAARASSLVDVARVLADLGQTDDATRCVDVAIDVARSAPVPSRTTSRVLRLARALAGTGRTREAVGLARTAVDEAPAIMDPGTRARVLGSAVGVLTELEQWDEADRLTETFLREARDHVDADDQATDLADVVDILAEKGRTDQAVRLARTAADLARTAPNPVWRAWAQVAVARALAKGPCADESIRLADTITKPDDRATALAAAAGALAEAGRTEEAVRLAYRAADLARTAPDATGRVRALVSVGRALVMIGRPDEAVDLVDAIADEEETVSREEGAGALAGVAEALAEAGRNQEAVRLARRAAGLARTAPDAANRAGTWVGAAKALAKVDDPDGAVEVARTITAPSQQARALVAAAQARGRTSEGRSLLRWALSLHSHESFLAELATLCPEALDEALRCARPPTP